MEKVIGTIFLVIVIWVGFALTVVVNTSNYCVERGWSEGYVTWSFKSYCKARIDQTDTLVPKDKAWDRLADANTK